MLPPGVDLQGIVEEAGVLESFVMFGFRKAACNHRFPVALEVRERNMIYPHPAIRRSSDPRERLARRLSVERAKLFHAVPFDEELHE